jgi:hypothetical protein
MNAGLSNLRLLKDHVLPGNLAAGNTHDDRLLATGLGVAGLFESYCNRKFLYTVDDTVTFTGDRLMYYLPRYPMVSVGAIETRDDASTGWETYGTGLTALANYDERSGMIDFGAIIGDGRTRVRVTYTGGYWWDTSEDESEAQPSGSTALPSELQMLFWMQAKHYWQANDPMRIAMGMEPGKRNELGRMNLFGVLDPKSIAPVVAAALDKWRRWQVT